jgi:leucyl-tRNA synthetase
VNGAAIPIWIADYVLISYGTGAIMAVPAHDTRDYEFAVQFKLPIVAVVDPGERPNVQRAEVLAGRDCFVGEGIAVNSGPYDGMPTAEFKTRIAADLASSGLGTQAVNYKLRDWLFSRQRFWGEPFPVLHEINDAGQFTGLMRAVLPNELPVDLPHLEDYKPHGRPEPPLAKAPHDWLYPVIDGKRYRRETNTMPQWAGSCWYYLRFIDPRNEKAFVDREKEKAWMPVDLYIGGAEHAVLHLLYSRFWHKVLFDRGYVSTDEPFQRLVNQGMILGETEFTTYQTSSGVMVTTSDVVETPDGKSVLKGTGEEVTARKIDADQVDKQGDVWVLKSDPEVRVDSRAHKMSKSRGNVVNPDEVVRDYGADSLRLYEMFMGPLEASKPWSMASVNGVRNFLERAWRMIVDDKAPEMTLHAAVQNVEPTDEQLRVLHKTIKAVTADYSTLGFNTAIARLMEFVNFYTRQSVRPKSVMEQFVLLLAPMAPHIGEELWQILRHDKTLAYERWPAFDEALTQDATIEIPVQVNGKVRSKVVVAANAPNDVVLAAAKSDEKVQTWLAGKQIVKEVVVPGRLINFVVK